jgi:hypothetical protein
MNQQHEGTNPSSPEEDPMTEQNESANPSSPDESYSGDEVLSERVESLLIQSKLEFEEIKRGLERLIADGEQSAVTMTASLTRAHGYILEAKDVVTNWTQLSADIDEVNFSEYISRRKAENRASHPSCEDDIPFDRPPRDGSGACLREAAGHEGI